MSDQSITPPSVIDLNTKQKKRKKIIVRSIVVTSCTVIMGVGIGGIVYATQHPYVVVDTTQTKLSIPDGFIYDVDIGHPWSNGHLDLTVCFSDPYKYPNLDYDDFKGANNNNHFVWTMKIDDKHAMYANDFHIDSGCGCFAWTKHNDTKYKNEKFQIWVEVELIIHGFVDHYFLQSDPITLTIKGA